MKANRKSAEIERRMEAEAEERRAELNALASNTLFRKWMVRLMARYRYGKQMGDMDPFDFGKHMGVHEVIADFIFNSDEGMSILSEYLETTTGKNNLK